MNQHDVSARTRNPGAGLLVLAILALALLQACECTPTDPGDGSLYRIQGTDMGPMHQNILVYRDGQLLDDATVTVNGVVIPRTDSGFYQGKLPAQVPVGSPLALEVSAGGVIVRGTGMVPETPQITAPAMGSSFAPGDTITVRWTSETTPERFEVTAGWPVSGGNAGKSFAAPAAARSLDVPASEFPPGTEVTIDVFAYNDGSFTGPAAPDSRMSIRGDDYVSKVVVKIAP